ncbi:MAG: L-serine ammonia-lyase, iron-sulfur-dependent, subunit alpha, partial [Spirochaetales bacterium]|nr:L-serine ammonia-lyase, iron-sulfur-dependent, subunit alpha [Spirochaetales bacterium]
NGCALPVVINSGSGNHGMAVSLTVLVYARHLGVSEGKTYRALAISNLISIHIKKNIGDLSAFCGAVSAACGAGAAITYLHGGTEAQIGNTIINTLANVGGLICDGAKSSCAAKIATSVNAAILAHEMSMKGIVFRDGDGIVQPDVEQTIKSIGHIGKTGMAKTDEEVLKIMLGEVRFD